MFRDETAKVRRKAVQSEIVPQCSSTVNMSIGSIAYSSLRCGRKCSSGPVDSGTNTYEQETRISGLPWPSDPALSQETARSCYSSSSSSCFFTSTPEKFLLSTIEIMTAYFFDQIVMFNTWLAGIPALYYAPSCEESPLRHAIQSASLFLLANQSADPAATGAARRSYGQCLRLLNSILGNPREKSSDETLCTVLILHLICVSSLFFFPCLSTRPPLKSLVKKRVLLNLAFSSRTSQETDLQTRGLTSKPAKHCFYSEASKTTRFSRIQRSQTLWSFSR